MVLVGSYILAAQQREERQKNISLVGLAESYRIGTT
jgi:hypothetical protein